MMLEVKSSSEAFFCAHSQLTLDLDKNMGSNCISLDFHSAKLKHNSGSFSDFVMDIFKYHV